MEGAGISVWRAELRRAQGDVAELIRLPARITRPVETVPRGSLPIENAVRDAMKNSRIKAPFAAAAEHVVGLPGVEEEPALTPQLR